ncbi:hypothetical protein PC120_g4553 [Phytophthora cactorum]|nr:hypothetical protein PC120_g4553 [Phytophthora cactorum]
MVKCKEDREKVQTRKPQKRRVGKLRNGLIAGEVPCICGGGQSTARKRTRVCSSRKSRAALVVASTPRLLSQELCACARGRNFSSSWATTRWARDSREISLRVETNRFQSVHFRVQSEQASCCDVA